jgi:hypothetical protein
MDDIMQSTIVPYCANAIEHQDNIQTGEIKKYTSKYYKNKLEKDPDYFRNKRNREAEKLKYETKRDEILDYQKKYNLKHRDDILDYQKQYYRDNKEKLCRKAQERQNERVCCPLCNKSIAKGSLSKHTERPICGKRQNRMNTNINVVQTETQNENNLPPKNKRIKLKIVKKIKDTKLAE